MLNHYQELTVSTGRPFEVRDIGKDICAMVRESGILEGMVTITSLHTTCALTINENEERLLEDIRNLFLTIVPPDGAYMHNDLHLRVNIPPDEPRNAHAHLIAMMLGNSETLAVHDGRPMLGRFQSILFLDMDGPRERTLAVQVLGVS